MISEAMFALALGCAGSATSLPGDVWRFDNVEALSGDRAGNAPRYVLRDGGEHDGVHLDYLSEVIDGRRLDYQCHDRESVWWLGEQTSQHSIKPASQPQVKAFGKMVGFVSSDVSSFEAHGRYGKGFIAEVGEYESTKPTPCTVVMGGDTVRATVSTERREFLAKISHTLIRMPLNAERDSLESYTITRRRWFTADEPVLIGVQTVSESRGYGDKQPEITSQFYTISPSEFADLADCQRKENKDILKNAQATFENGFINISLPENSGDIGVWVDVSLTSLDGSYCPAFGLRFVGTSFSRYDVSKLPPGQYMLTLRTQWSEYKKLVVKP